MTNSKGFEPRAAGSQAIADDTTWANVSLPLPTGVDAPSSSSTRGRSPSDSGHDSAELPADCEPRNEEKHQTKRGTGSGVLGCTITVERVEGRGDGLEWDENNENWLVEVMAYDTSLE